MTGQLNEFSSIPRETARAARAVFGSSNFYIQVGERLESIMEGIHLESLAVPMKPAHAGAAILPLITFFQFTEGLTDVQAADAARTRVEWKFALHQPINTLGLHRNALCEFRRHAFGNVASQRELQKLVDRLATLNPPCDESLSNYEVLDVLSRICTVNVARMEWEAMFGALGALAGRFPMWLRQVAHPHWYGRYTYLPAASSSTASLRQQTLSLPELGADIKHLLEEVEHTENPQIKEIQEIKLLQRIWEKQKEAWGKAFTGQFETSNWTDCDFCIINTG